MKIKFVLVIGALCFIFSSCSNNAIIESNSTDRINSEVDMNSESEPSVEPTLIVLESKPDIAAESYQSIPNKNENNSDEVPVWIVGKNVNFREEASLESGVISRLSSPQNLMLLSQNGEWACVKVGEKQGYVHSDFISMTEPNIETPMVTNGGTFVHGNTNDSNDKEVVPVDIERSSITIAIDAGHQAKGNNEQEPIGPDASSSKAKVSSGTSGIVTGVPEYELTLDVSLKLRDELAARGYNVFMIRETHDINISNKERANMATQAEADVFVRIHADGSENSSVNGILTLSPSANNTFIPELCDSSLALSENILEAMVASTGAKNRGVMKVDNMSGINWATMPVTIVEMGLMTNPTEDELMQTGEYQSKLVLGIANGIDKYFSENI